MAAMTVLHHIFDPLCAWCYAGAPLVEAVHSVPGPAVRLFIAAA